jgi:ribosome-binding protein aMBF1 (putative translation factor)
MYELTLNSAQLERFKQAAKRKMRGKGWTMKILAIEIGRKPSAVYSFFSHSDKPRRFLAAEIATVLEMTHKDWE